MFGLVLVLCIMGVMSVLMFLVNLANSVDHKYSVGHRVVDLIGSIVMMVFVAYIIFMIRRGL